MALELRESLPVAPDGLVFEWTAAELALVDLARRQADDIEQLESALAVEGLTVRGSAGQPRLNPLVGELRLSRLALLRMLSELRVADQGPLAKNATKQRAANIRWDRERRDRA